MSIKQNRDRPNYIYGLDLIRFVAAALVGLFHLTWLEGSVSLLAWYGWIGVQIFFVISGFVISQSANNATPIKFVRSRFLRLYPAAWICAAISLAILTCTIHMTSYWLRPSVLSLTLYPTGPFLASAYWTLPIEITFYGLIFVVLLTRRFRQVEGIAIILGAASSIYIIAYSLHCAGIISLPWLNFGYNSWKNLLLLRHGVYFAIGIFMWLWSEGLLTRTGVAAGIVCFAVAPLEITCRSAEILPLMPVSVDLLSVWPVPVAVWFAFCGLIAASAFWRAKVLQAPPLLLKCARLAGLLSYPLYLIHEIAGKAARTILIDLGFSYLVSAVGALMVAVLIALAIAGVAEPALRAALSSGLTTIRARVATRGWLPRLDRPGGTL
jgi:exopolysaccharide production protein ExoZ